MLELDTTYENNNSKISFWPSPDSSNPYLNPYDSEYVFSYDPHQYHRIKEILDNVYNENTERRKSCNCFICGDNPINFDTEKAEVTIMCCTCHIRNIRYLFKLIESNDYTINEDIIRKVTNISWTFENIWKYDISYRASSMTSPKFIEFFLDTLLDKAKNFDHYLDKDDYDIKKLWRSYSNFLVTFHTFGFYLQVNSLIEENKLNLVYLAILQYIDAISTNFSRTVKYYIIDRIKTPTYFTVELAYDLEQMLQKYPGVMESNMHSKFEDMSNLLFNTYNLTKKYKEDLEKNNLEFNFSNLWNNIVKIHLCDYANPKYLKEIISSSKYKYRNNPYSSYDNTLLSMYIDFNKYNFSDINIMSMFNAAGLYCAIEFFLLMEDYNKIVTVIEQFMYTLTSKFNFKISENSNDIAIYTDLTILLEAYKNEYE